MRILLVLLLAMLSLPHAATGGDAVEPTGDSWPAFRGADRSGIAAGRPPASWDVEAGTNLLFKTPIPGLAHASPVVWGNRVFIATAVPASGEAALKVGLYGDVDTIDEGGYAWRVYAVDATSGEILWQRTAHQAEVAVARHTKATHANSTPVTDGERVVAFFGSAGGLYAFRAADGEPLWQVEMEPIDTGWFYDPSYQWGHASSPIIWRDRVIIQVDRAEGSFLAAYALADGELLWRRQRPEISSWGTPVVVEGSKGPELVTFGGRAVRGYDPLTGEELWQLAPTSEVTVASPVPANGLVYVSNGYRPVQPIYAIRPGGRGDLSLPEGETSSQHVAWSHPRGGNYITTPLVYDGELYILSNNGVLTCYDAATGEEIYKQRVGRGEGFSGSMVAAAGRLYLPAEDGEVFVVKAGTEYELLAENPVGEVLMTTPAITGDTLYIRGRDHLFAFAEAEEEGGEDGTEGGGVR